MTNPLRLDLDRPAHGWTTVRLTLPDGHLEWAASYTPVDSLSGLVGALADLVAGGQDQRVGFNAEPDWHELRLRTTNGLTCVAVWYFSPGQQAGVLRGTTTAPTTVVVRALWRGVRRLQAALSAVEFAAAWRHPFPTQRVAHLAEMVGRSATTGPAPPHGAGVGVRTT
jgi:hypothetical protein